MFLNSFEPQLRIMNIIGLLILLIVINVINGLPWWLSSKGPTCNAGAACLIPGSGRFPEGGQGNPLQYSCQENPMGRGAWQATQSIGLERVGPN